MSRIGPAKNKARTRAGRRQHHRKPDHQAECSTPDEEQQQIAKEHQILDINADIKKFFIGTASFEQHYEAQNKDRVRYLAGMTILQQNGVEIAQNARVRALAASWARKDYELSNAFLMNENAFGLVEVLKALTLLDSGRQLRAEEKKLRILSDAGNKVRPWKISKIKSEIANLKDTTPKFGSVGRSLCQYVKNWVRHFSKDELEFYALHLPKDPWKKLADICHLHPDNDFSSLPWFLRYCFGDPAPEDTVVGHYTNLTAENVNELIEKYPVPYSHVKHLGKYLTEQSKQHIAEIDKLDQVIWYYENLRCHKVDQILLERLSNGETTSLPTGKLMERLLTIKMIREGIPQRGQYQKNVECTGNPEEAAFFYLLIPQAQKRLDNIRLTLESPVVVMGDRSGSMEVAIRTSTIIASLLTAICNAELVFFDNENMNAPFIPSNVEEVLQMAVTIQTRGCTAPAASLWPFYSSKKVLQTIIMVTDEEENAAYKNMRFAEMFGKYRSEVSPQCRLVFVSFLRNQHAKGNMITELEKRGITEKVMQFRFDSSRPDLSKLDKMFGLLSAETANFEQQICNLNADFITNGLTNTMKQLCQASGRKN